MIPSLWLYELVCRKLWCQIQQHLQTKCFFYYETHSKKHVQVEMHPVMMLHANYTILYIKVQRHNGLMNL